MLYDLQALGLYCWRWQETCVLPHLELFVKPGKVFFSQNAWCLLPGTNLTVLAQVHRNTDPFTIFQKVSMQCQYFRPEADVADLEQELIETIQFGQ